MTNRTSSAFRDNDNPLKGGFYCNYKLNNPNQRFLEILTFFLITGVHENGTRSKSNIILQFSNAQRLVCYLDNFSALSTGYIRSETSALLLTMSLHMLALAHTF